MILATTPMRKHLRQCLPIPLFRRAEADPGIEAIIDECESHVQSLECELEETGRERREAVEEYENLQEELEYLEKKHLRAFGSIKEILDEFENNGVSKQSLIDAVRKIID